MILRMIFNFFLWVGMLWLINLTTTGIDITFEGFSLCEIRGLYTSMSMGEPSVDNKIILIARAGMKFCDKFHS